MAITQVPAPVTTVSAGGSSATWYPYPTASAECFLDGPFTAGVYKISVWTNQDGVTPVVTWSARKTGDVTVTSGSTRDEDNSTPLNLAYTYFTVTEAWNYFVFTVNQANCFISLEKVGASATAPTTVIVYRSSGDVTLASSTSVLLLGGGGGGGNGSWAGGGGGSGYAVTATVPAGTYPLVVGAGGVGGSAGGATTFAGYTANGGSAGGSGYGGGPGGSGGGGPLNGFGSPGVGGYQGSTGGDAGWGAGGTGSGVSINTAYGPQTSNTTNRMVAGVYAGGSGGNANTPDGTPGLDTTAFGAGGMGGQRGGNGGKGGSGGLAFIRVRS